MGVRVGAAISYRRRAWSDVMRFVVYFFACCGGFRDPLSEYLIMVSYILRYG